MEILKAVKRLALLPVVLAAVIPQCLFGWGYETHRIIARKTWAELDPATRAAITQLLEPGETLASISTWADENRPKHPETGPWHYVNIPITAERGDWQRYCPEAGCVLRELDIVRTRLADTSLDRAQRAEALKFLVHLVSDLHQPLHTADRGDRGGNGVPVVFEDRATNLHSVWDTALLMSAIRAQPALRERLEAPLSAEEAQTLGAGTPADWAWEAQAVSRDVVYGKLPAGSPAVLDSDYQSAAVDAIELQIRRASARLAFLLRTSLAH